MKFIRFGGLSPVNHKKFYKIDSYHSPPCKRGVYAFIYPYVEDFLISWKISNHDESWRARYNKFYRANKKIFEYKGNVWVHFIEEAVKLNMNIEIKKDWVKVNTKDLKRLFSVVKHKRMVELQKDYITYGINTKDLKDPYKRGLGGFFCKDELEVFIEKI